MIVIATPRSGATKFCIDLAEETGLEFFGEMHTAHIADYPPTHIQLHNKGQEHETRLQRSWEAGDYMKSLSNIDQYVALANAGDTTNLLPFADYLICRKDHENLYKSILNFTVKLNPDIDLNGFAFIYGKTLFNNYASMLDYSYHTGKPIQWYEDLFPSADTNYIEIQSHSQAPQALGMWSQFAEQYSIEDKIQRLL